MCRSLIALALTTGCTVGSPGTIDEVPTAKTTVTVTDARLSLVTLVDDAFPNGYPTITLVNTAEVDDTIVGVTSTISSRGGMNITLYGDDWIERKGVESFTLPALGTFQIDHKNNEIALYNSMPPAVGEQFDITLEFADASVLTFPVVVEP